MAENVVFLYTLFYEKYYNCATIESSGLHETLLAYQSCFGEKYTYKITIQVVLNN